MRLVLQLGGVVLRFVFPLGGVVLRLVLQLGGVVLRLVLPLGGVALRRMLRILRYGRRARTVKPHGERALPQLAGSVEHSRIVLRGKPRAVKRYDKRLKIHRGVALNLAYGSFGRAAALKQVQKIRRPYAERAQAVKKRERVKLGQLAFPVGVQKRFDILRHYLFGDYLLQHIFAKL